MKTDINSMDGYEFEGFAAFKTILKKSRNDTNALMYGAGTRWKVLLAFPTCFASAFCGKCISVIISKYVPSVWIILAIIYVISACCVAIAIIVWRKYSSKSDILEVSALAG
jgi:ABC-type sugar transport system permease subunit